MKQANALMRMFIGLYIPVLMMQSEPFPYSNINRESNFLRVTNNKQKLSSYALSAASEKKKNSVIFHAIQSLKPVASI